MTIENKNNPDDSTEEKSSGSVNATSDKEEISSASNSEQGNFFSALIAVLKDTKATIRLTVVILFLFVIIWIIFVAGIYILSPEKITLGESTLTFSTGKDVVQAVLPSNIVWLDTQIEIEPDSIVNVEADGRVHLAIHYVVEAANKDFVVKYPWTDPNGQGTAARVIEQVPGDASRDGQKLCPSAKYGQLLAYVGLEKLDKNKPWPVHGKIQVLGKKGVIENDTDKKQRIWLAVNDIVLNASKYSEQAYLLNEDSCHLAERYGFETKCDQHAVIDAKKRWKEIKNKEYWNIWFDDNVGSYIVQFDMKNPAESVPNYCELTRDDYLEKYNISDLDDGDQQSINESYTTSDMGVIYRNAIRLAAKHGAEEKILVIFDIDNTLLAMNGPLGSDQWYDWQKELDENDVNKIPSLLDAQNALFFVNSMRLTQSNIPQILSELHNRGFQTLALTARGMSSRLVTHRELKRNNIQFYNNLFLTGHKEEFMPITSTEQRNVLYEDAVIMAAGQNKGLILLELLDKSTSEIKGIIFIDDKDYNITDFRKAIEQEEYDLITFKYTGEAEEVGNFPNEGTMEDWCYTERLLLALQQTTGPSNYQISNVVTKACE